MKNILILFSFLAFVACSNCDPATCTKPNCCKKTQSNNTPNTQDNNAPSTVAYDCPMRCEGAKSDKPGTCPVCKMDLKSVQ